MINVYNSGSFTYIALKLGVVVADLHPQLVLWAQQIEQQLCLKTYAFNVGGHPVCLLVKYLLNHHMNLNKTLRKTSLVAHVQYI